MVLRQLKSLLKVLRTKKKDYFENTFPSNLLLNPIRNQVHFIRRKTTENVAHPILIKFTAVIQLFKYYLTNKEK